MKQVEGKAALITGGASGIGKATAEEFLQRKMKVSIIDVHENELTKTVNELQSLYGEKQIIGFPCDVRNREQLENVMLQSKSFFGHLDILVNNAGIFDEDAYEKVIHVNLISVIAGTQLAIKHLVNDKGEKKGTVLNTASITAVEIWPLIPVYAASKNGVLGYTKSMGHKENVEKTGVKVNAICPELTDTAIIRNIYAEDNEELMRFLESLYKGNILNPKRVAEGFLKILEDDVTGQALVVSITKGNYYVPVNESEEV